MKARKAIRITAILLFIIGACLVLYAPVTKLISDWLMTNAQTEFIEQKDSLIASGDDYLSDLYDEMTEFNEELFANGQSELFKQSAYEKTLIDLSDWDIKGSMLGIIKVPSIDITLPVYLGTNKDNMARGATHMSYTSYPINTPNSNSVIAAHRGWGGAEFFRYIDKVKIGDDIILENLWYTMVYKVTEIKIVDKHDINSILIQPGKTMLTLSTCHPYTINTHRYLVFAQLYEVKD